MTFSLNKGTVWDVPLVPNMVHPELNEAHRVVV